MSFDLKILQGNLLIGSDGDIKKVENSEKLIQDILKIAITPLNSNPFQPGYGSLISKTLIGNPLPMDFLSSTASSQLKNCLENLQKLQQQQAVRQPVSASEQLAAIGNIIVERNQSDPRFWEVVIKALTRDFSVVSTQFTVDPI